MLKPLTLFLVGFGLVSLSGCSAYSPEERQAKVACEILAAKDSNYNSTFVEVRVRFLNSKIDQLSETDSFLTVPLTIAARTKLFEVDKDEVSLRDLLSDYVPAPQNPLLSPDWNRRLRAKAIISFIREKYEIPAAEKACSNLGINVN